MLEEVMRKDGEINIQPGAYRKKFPAQRYGHLNIKGLQLLKNKEMVSGLPTIKPLEHVCEGCVVGKQTRQSFPVGKSKRAEAILELIHTDLCGPIRTESLVEKQSGSVVKILRSDRGGEFTSTEFQTFCDEHGIKKQLTTPYSPEQNGVAERKNRTVIEMARSMLK
nr:copia-type polyprotein [Tanacetum cinerariifolium]